MDPIRDHLPIRLRRGTLIPALNSSLIPALNLESSSGAIPNEKLRRGIPEWIPHNVCRQILRRHFGTAKIRLTDRAIDELQSQPPPQSPSQSPPGMAEPEAEPKTQSASQWLNAPSKAHPDNCQPCWFTAKNKGCDRDGCLFCHQPHDTGDVRLSHARTSARTRQRQARRQIQRDFIDAHVRIKPEAKRPVQSWPLSEFQISRPVGTASVLPNQTAPSQMGAAEMIS